MSTVRPTSDLDPFSPEFRADPYSHYAQLRALGPVVWLERYGIWAVTHYEAVKSVLLDHGLFSNAGGGGLANYFIDPPWRRPSIILEVDPPEHERARRVLNHVFSRTALQALRKGFEVHAEQLVDAAVSRGTLDAVTDLVQPFPLTVFADAVGLAKEDRQNLLTYGAMVFGGFGPSNPWYEELMQNAEAISAWILARCRRDSLTPNGFGAAIHAFADTGDLTEEEATLLVRSLLSAGVDTTIDSIGLALKCLLDHPDQWRLLRDEPSLARAAFEEATRFDSSSQSLIRTTLRAAEFQGVQLAKHAKVMVFIGSAGRDPAQWDEPDRFDIRRRNPGQMGYGVGVHSCVAQMLARLEGDVFFTALAKAVDGLEAAGPAALRLNPGLRGLSSLPIRLTSKA
ncbi:MAG TPA: cytochrome P450 [Caulobacteraceae bacterium]|nr:cytochrome P450 [Caulobacteraceae bacterium]